MVNRVLLQVLEQLCVSACSKSKSPSSVAEGRPQLPLNIEVEFAMTKVSKPALHCGFDKISLVLYYINVQSRLVVLRAVRIQIRSGFVEISVLTTKILTFNVIKNKLCIQI